MLSLRARVLLALGVVVGAFSFALAVNAVELARIGVSLTLVNEVYLPLASVSSRMGATVERGDLAPLLEEARGTLSRARTEDAEERAAINAADRQVDEVESAWRGAGPRDVVRDEILQLAVLVDSRITAVSDKTARAQSGAVRTAVGSGLVAVAVAIGVLVAARRALGPVEQLTDAVRQLAEGKPLPPLEVGGGDEIASLARAVSTMAQAVAERDAERDRRVRSERLALVGQMLAQVTHEVRNPLNALSLNVELLADDLRASAFVGQEAALALATGLNGEIRRLEAVTERYLDLARRPALVLALEDPVALASSVVAGETAALQRQGVAVEVTVDGSPPPVEIDGGVVRRALLNLLQNAAQAGAKKITLHVSGLDGVRFRVEDDGLGVPEAVRTQIFEPFFTTRAVGTGLGLAVARQSIEDAGGTLHYRPGEPGSVFEIVLSPLRRGP